MPLDIVIGAQYGDEGKGKITDALAEDASAIVRFQGGNNAGHTLVIDDVTYKLHLVPSGIVRPDVWCLLGNGVVVDPRVLVAEIAELHAQGISTDRLRVSFNAHLIMPYHVALDHAEEDGRDSTTVIGTTRRGIGPCYADKASRIGVRGQDLADKDGLARLVRTALDHHRPRLGDRADDPALSLEAIVDEYHEFASSLSDMLEDVSPRIWDLLADDRLVIGEGAQGVLLDIDHGMYPFVTSSNCLPGQAAAGCGVPPQAIRRVYGVAKAYPTRVDTVGPFPSAMEQGVGIEETLIHRGGEFGTTTGRRRRAGWMDAVSLEYAVRVAGITDLVITKMDVMYDTELQLATSYEIDGVELPRYPTRYSELVRARARYERMPGFTGDISSARSFAELPEPARRYLLRTSELAGARLTFVGVGQSREQLIEVTDV